MHSHTELTRDQIRQFETEMDELYQQLYTLTISFPKTEIDAPKEQKTMITTPILFSAGGLTSIIYSYTVVSKCPENLDAGLKLLAMCETFDQARHKTLAERRARIARTQKELQKIAWDHCIT